MQSHTEHTDQMAGIQSPTTACTVLGDAQSSNNLTAEEAVAVAHGSMAQKHKGDMLTRGADILELQGMSAFHIQSCAEIRGWQVHNT